MKKIFFTMVTFALLISSISVFGARYEDVAEGTNYKTAIENLSNLGIVSGYNGKFNPGGNITKAEVSKIVAVVGGIEEEAATKSGIKRFSDVEIGNWSTGYINAVADKGYILGYPNGYFMPENNITYAEITTIVLRLLGYDSTILGDNWPYAYMIKADELKITDGITLGDFDLINRAQVCQIIDNALDKKIYGKNETLSNIVSSIRYSDPIVIKNRDAYMDLFSFGITKDNSVNYSVIRDGKNSSISEIEPYDIVYLSESNNTIYVYCDKISGIYKEAFPSKADLTSVDISGNILEIETSTASNKLGEKTGSYKLNSRITALIGKDGKIVDVVDLNSVGNSEYGVLLSVGEKISEQVHDKGEETKFINILSGDGQIISYETNKDYSNYIGLVGKLSFDEDGYVSFKTTANTTKIEGKVDKVNGKIGDSYLTTDATLIELIYSSETNTGTAMANVIDIEDIAVDEIYGSNVVFALKTGDFDDISFAVLRNVTNNGYTYGVLTDSQVSNRGMNISSSYEVVVNGITKNYIATFGQEISKDTPVAMIIDGGTVKSISPLKASARGKLSAIDGLRVKIGNKIYEIAEDAQIYRYTTRSGFMGLSVNGAKEYVGSTASVYTDAKSVSGGLARVIVIYE